MNLKIQKSFSSSESVFKIKSSYFLLKVTNETRSSSSSSSKFKLWYPKVCYSNYDSSLNGYLEISFYLNISIIKPHIMPKVSPK